MPDAEKNNRLPTYHQADVPPPMKFTARDGLILEAIHAHDGLLADYQIRQLFFTGERQTRGRLSTLYHNGYLNRPNRQQRASLDCMVYWLTRKGAAHVAGLAGEPAHGFKWRSAPRWSQVRHDLAVNDLRIAVTQASNNDPNLTLCEWIPEGAFWSQPDTVSYVDHFKRKTQRRVIPDGFFVVEKETYRSRLLLEVDMRTEDNPRFGQEKVLPGIAYVRSEAYRRRFGYKSGRWLIVTTGKQRLINMKVQTERVARRDARLFHFTTFDQVTTETVLKAPIWLRGGDNQPRALFQAG